VVGLSSAAMPLALTMAQTFFAIALGAITLFITFFGLYVISSVLWADRWVRRPK
jgi:hypothetical protein